VDLVAGANRALPPGPATVAVVGPFDLSAVVLGDTGRVAGDDDFVFYNQPSAPGVRLESGAVTVEFAALRLGAARVVVLASPEDLRTPFARLPVPALTVRSGGRVVARFRPDGLTRETVVQLAEFYRRAGAWKLRAVGQGYTDGLAGLARDFGVEIDDAGEESASSGVGAPAPAWSPPGSWLAGSWLAGSPLPGLSPPARPGVPPAGLVRDVVDATNRERASAGLPPLQLEPRLGVAAQAHAEDMVGRRFFAHDTPDGRTVADRVLAAGYAYAVVAENLAAGQRSPAEVVQGWMSSPGHRANILAPAVRQIGVGYVGGGEYGTTWVQVFGTPR
jgi:stress response protein SCP2